LNKRTESFEIYILLKSKTANKVRDFTANGVSLLFAKAAIIIGH
jgi:hypothetical protein